MADLNTNATDRISSRKGITTTGIFQVSDFPDVQAGAIPLNSEFYLLKNSFTLVNRFDAGNDQNVTLSHEDRGNSTLTYAGGGDLYTATFSANSFNNSRFEFTNFLTVAPTTFWNITGAAGGFHTWAEGAITMVAPASSIGTISGIIQLTVQNGTIVGFQNGLISKNNTVAIIQNLRLQSSGVGSDAIVRLEGVHPFGAVLRAVGMVTGPNESVVYISPSLLESSTAVVDIDTVENLGIGTYYKTGPTGTFTSLTNQEFTQASVAVDNNGGNARFTINNDSINVQENDIIENTVSSPSNYDGIYEVFNVVITPATSTAWECRDPITKIPLSHTSNGTATVTTHLTRVTGPDTSALNADNLVHMLSTNYDFAGRIRGTPTGTTFDLKTKFKTGTGSETGTWEESVGQFIDVVDNSTVNSINIVSAVIGGVRFDKGSALTNLIDGDKVNLSGFTTNPQYNRSDVFISNVQANTFDVVNQGIAFGTTEAGTSTSVLSTLTSFEHGLTTDEGALLSSINYATGAAVRGTPPATDVTFDLRVPFNSGSGFTATISAVSSTGAIETIGITTAGTGYTVGTLLDAKPDSATSLGIGEIIEITSVGGSGDVTGVTSKEVGTGYTTADTLTFGEFGNYDLNSLDQTNPQVIVSDSTGSPNSMTVAGWTNDVNTATVTPGVGTFDNIIVGDLSNPASPLSINERGILIDQTTGHLRYTGLNPITVSKTARLEVVKGAASAEVYTFKVQIQKGGSGSFVDLPDSQLYKLTVTNVVNSVNMNDECELETNDVLRISVSADTTASALTINGNGKFKL